MFKKFLVPLDGSEQSERVGEWATGLARGLGASVTFLAVVDPDEVERPDHVPPHGPTQGTAAGRGGYDRSPEFTQSGFAPGAPVGGSFGAHDRGQAPSYGIQAIEGAVEQARVYLVGRAEQARAAGVQADYEATAGKPADEIINVAKKSGADIIAMATHRESALARGILGSVTDRVVHTSSVPVLAVRPESPGGFEGNAGAPSTIVVPLDGSELSERSVPVARAIADAVGAGLIFMRSMSGPYYGTSEAGMEYVPANFGMNETRSETLTYLERFVSEAQAAGLRAEARTMLGTAAGCIMDVADQAEGSLIVMSTHGRTGFRRFFLGSVTDKVVRSSGHPVLILPSPES